MSPQAPSRCSAAPRPSSLLRSRTRAKLQTDSQAIWFRDGRERDERVIGSPPEGAEAALGVLAHGESDSGVRTSGRTRSAAPRGDESVRTRDRCLVVQRSLTTGCSRACGVAPAAPYRCTDALSSIGSRGMTRRFQGAHRCPDTRTSNGVSQHLHNDERNSARQQQRQHFQQLRNISQLVVMLLLSLASGSNTQPGSSAKLPILEFLDGFSRV